MAQKKQITLYLSAAELDEVERLAEQASGSINRAGFLRYSLVMGAYVARQALQEVKPAVLGLATVKTLLRTRAGRSLIKVAELDQEELTEE